MTQGKGSKIDQFSQLLGHLWKILPFKSQIFDVGHLEQLFRNGSELIVNESETLEFFHFRETIGKTFYLAITDLKQL